MTDPLRKAAEAAVDDLTECARLLGLTQAKKGTGAYGPDDARLETSWHKSIAAHTRTIRAALAAPQQGTAMMEHKTIAVQRFRDPNGAPTCCADHQAGKTCRFLGVRNFGTVDVCMLGEQRDLSPRTAEFQRPDARCEVWQTPNTKISGGTSAASTS